MEVRAHAALVSFVESHGQTVAAVQGDKLWITTSFSKLAKNADGSWGDIEYTAWVTECVPATKKAVRDWLGY